MDKLERFLNDQTGPLSDNPDLLRREIAYQRLKDVLQHADLEAGEVLSENRLSKALGISRTPVREALQQLAQEGLVQIIPGRAVTVASPSVRSVMNVVHIRLLLEPELVRLSADSLSEPELHELGEIVDTMDRACNLGDHQLWSRTDTRFHDIVADACPNALLAEVVIQMRNRAHHLASIDSQTNPSRLKECTAEHREIVDCLIDHDGDRAAEATRNHIGILRESLFSRLSYG
jgi:DNA-binding GntR family transcriptional regulator